jgi:ribosomal protein S13
MKQQINIPLSKFKFIGIVEKYDEEVVRFKKITGIDLNNTLEHLNVNPLKKNVNEAYTIDEDLKQTLIKLHSEDYELYNKSLQIAGY